MAPVARELCGQGGVLEPLQTRDSIEGLLEELRRIVAEKASAPVTLAGYSWGAWLGILFAARHPGLVKKLILISSGPLEDQAAPAVHRNRWARLSVQEREEAARLQKNLGDPANFARFGELMSKADFYDPLPVQGGEAELRPELYEPVWREGKKMREDGSLLEEVKKIQCPVVALHGDHDPHPAEGVQKSLSVLLKNFRFILLSKCGHTPWMEKRARDEFFKVLGEELM